MTDEVLKRDPIDDIARVCVKAVVVRMRLADKRVLVDRYLARNPPFDAEASSIIDELDDIIACADKLLDGLAEWNEQRAKCEYGPS